MTESLRERAAEVAGYNGRRVLGKWECGKEFGGIASLGSRLMAITRADATEFYKGEGLDD